MRFSNEMMEISQELEIKKEYAVIQCVYSDKETKYDDREIELLWTLHKKKIDISDAIYVVNINGYIGESTKKEIQYAISKEKEVIYHESIIK